ncbi:MAG TPA: decarboxylating 6-phosphogluconate dehydrogenase [Vicinamibacterales bacterium]|nr:decarboxylating 6-phosphogluconate dehydrogenase [Vicinamibacterales bacterium]
MSFAMVGLGRMGANMVTRLQRAGLPSFVFDINPQAVAALTAAGATGAASIADLVARMPPPRTIWLMLPAAIVDRQIAQLAPLLAAGDTIIDGGNSRYHDDIRRAAELKTSGIHYLDVGTSGGVWGLERGYCLMIGGERSVVERLDPIFSALSPGGQALGSRPSALAGSEPPGPSAKGPGPDTAPRGYLHCGAAGAGHFVKMVHNGIEYGLMAAYAEGFNILKHANAGAVDHSHDAETTPMAHPEHYRYDFDLAAIAEVWRHGSVISSWLLDLTAKALSESGGDLADFAGRVSDSGEGRWTIEAAIDEAVPANVLAAALFARFSSRGESDFGDKLLSALRMQFGGHQEKK